jgi:streptomycin 6-kinase
VALPGHPLHDEARLLRAADGRGYVVLHDHDPVRDALLLESLGSSLERTPMPAEDKLDLAVDTLRDAWRVSPDDVPGIDDDPAAPAGAAKALGLRELVLEADARFPGACDPAVLERALACVENRSRDERAPRVVVHGDPHPPNILRVEGVRRGAGSGWVLVDPDGFVCDPAYDLGVLLREWHARLDGLDPARARDLLVRWCRRVATRAELGPGGAERTWEWAFLERVSTGLHVTSFGAVELGERFLRSARTLL